MALRTDKSALTRSHSQKKPQQSVSPPAQNELRSRPFVIPAQPETSQPETPDLQTQLENAQRFGHSCSKIAASSRAIQPKLTIGAPGDQYEQEADLVAQQVVQRINAPGEGRSQPAQEPAQPEHATKQQATPDLQTQLQTQIETAQRFGHSFSKIVASSPAIIQPKLTIGAPGDQYEQEADRVAAQVVEQINAPSPAQSLPGQAVQQQQEKPEERQAKSEINPPHPSVQYPSPKKQSTTDTVTAIQAKGGKTEGTPATEGEQRPNHTGLPDGLKTGIESLSGINLDDVKVYYNSSQPAQLNALAYAQGSDIHVAPGQEQHLPHEVWHLVQQAQNRVKPTMHMKDGVPINDDAGLEHEADVMGAKALAPAAQLTGRLKEEELLQGKLSPVQRYTMPEPTNLAFRVSQNAQIAITGKKSLYATQTAIDAANLKLSTVGGTGGAYVVLTSTDETLPNYLALRLVRPTWKQARVINPAKTTAQDYRRNVKTKNTSPDAFWTHADCHLAAATIMGSEDTLAGEGNTERPITKSATGEIRPLAPVDKTLVTTQSLDDPGHVAHRGTYAFLIDAMPSFATFIRTNASEKQATEPETQKTAQEKIELAKEIEKASTIESVKVKSVEYIKLYRQIVTDKFLSRMFAEQFGVNEAAKPEVGDALMQVNDELEKQTRNANITKYNKDLQELMPRIAEYVKAFYAEFTVDPRALEMKELGRQIEDVVGLDEEEQKLEAYDVLLRRIKADDFLHTMFSGESAIKGDRLEDMWNFHWAGVVMKDGDDYVTLENLSTEFSSDINDKWYFQMYGTAKQSFHSEASDDSHVGNFPLTVPFRAFAPEQGPTKADYTEQNLIEFTVQKNTLLSVSQVCAVARKLPWTKLETPDPYKITMPILVKDFISKNPWIVTLMDPADKTKRLE